MDNEKEMSEQELADKISNLLKEKKHFEDKQINGAGGMTLEKRNLCDRRLKEIKKDTETFKQPKKQS